MVVFASLVGRAQNTTLIPDEGGTITLTGCFTTGQIHDHDRFVLAKPIVGSVASVQEATCSASGGDQLVKLQDLKQARLGSAILGHWVEIQGRLEGNHRSDAVREVHVKSYALVPVVVPPPPVAQRLPETYAPPPPSAAIVETPSAPIAEAAPAPSRVATTGVQHAKKRLPKTASSLPLIGLIGLASLAAGFALRSFVRRPMV
jgi:hypothetical protein